ncbi:MAG: SDR family oxidoreductase [Vicinamibacterales bacterium]
MRRTILLTGASGVVGRAVLERLRDVDVVCLTHQKALPGTGVAIVRGDVSRPLLGLSAAKFAELARRIQYIVHSAAMTAFNQPEGVIRDVNIVGTQRVLELAARAGVPLCHLSTAFAYADQHVPAGHRTHPYEVSKREAEQAVRTSGVPAVIVRPSIVIGDSVDGSMTQFQGFHFLMDLIVRGSFPLPGTAQALVDVVPRDLVASVVAALVARPDITGEYWVTSGDRALSLSQTVTIWAEHWHRLTGQPVRRPRMVSPDIVERLARPAFLPALPKELQATMSHALHLVKYVNITRPFPSSLAQLAALIGSPLLPTPELTLIRNVEGWSRHIGAGWSGPALSSSPRQPWA